MKQKNKFKKIMTREDVDIVDLSNKENAIKHYTRKDFDNFFIKFFGSFIKQGKKSHSYKILDYILLNLKKKTKENPIYIFMKLLKLLMPLLVLGKKTYNGKVQGVPTLIRGNRKNVLLINWLVRQFKGRSNKHGIDKEDILKVLIDTLNNKGAAVNLKKDHYLAVLKTRRNLRVQPWVYKFMYQEKIEKIKKLEIEKENKRIEKAKFSEFNTLWYKLNKYEIQIKTSAEQKIIKEIEKKKIHLK